VRVKTGDKTSRIRRYAMGNDLTRKATSLELGFVAEQEFDRVIDIGKVTWP
jgi:fumarate hydratase class II